MSSSFTRNVEAELKKIKPPKNQKFFGEDYVGGGQSRLQFLNIKIPQVRTIMKKLDNDQNGWREFEALWKESNIFEAKAVSLFWLEKQPTEVVCQNLKTVISWASDVDNWAHSDTYCGVLAKVFEFDPGLLLPTYQKWNGHSNPWFRRISMIGLMFYSRFRKKHPPFALIQKMVKPHLVASEYYVQKAVGWTLRESYNVYPVQTLQFVEKNLKLIHPDAWYATSEKMPKAIKNSLVKKRAKLRKMK